MILALKIIGWLVFWAAAVIVGGFAGKWLAKALFPPRDEDKEK